MFNIINYLTKTLVIAVNDESQRSKCSLIVHKKFRPSVTVVYSTR